MPSDRFQSLRRLPKGAQITTPNIRLIRKPLITSWSRWMDCPAGQAECGHEDFASLERVLIPPAFGHLRSLQQSAIPNRKLAYFAKATKAILRFSKGNGPRALLPKTWPAIRSFPSRKRRMVGLAGLPCGPSGVRPCQFEEWLAKACAAFKPTKISLHSKGFSSHQRSDTCGVFNNPQSAIHNPQSEILPMVGLAGFEPTTPCPPGRCATRLRYSPSFRRGHKQAG